jgi:hypothetical protein
MLSDLQLEERAMAQAIGTKAWLDEFLSDEPTDINVIPLRVTLIATAISTIATELNAKLKETPGPMGKELEKQATAQVEALNRELERLLKIARQLKSQQR